MHVVIINGSPRIQKFSNTDKIIGAFLKGLTDEGVTFEKYAISDRTSWSAIKTAYEANTQVIIALPLYVECVPGLLLEFLGTLPEKDKETQLSFILQGGFAEASQYRCGEEFLKKLTEYLGCTYGGCLVKGDNFSIRFLEGEQREHATAPYTRMGTLFAHKHGFDNEEASKFAGPEYFSLPRRLLIGFAFGTFAKKIFRNVAVKWGCKEPLDAKPYL